jgi:hypothetical protein
MNRRFFLLAIAFLLLVQSDSLAQSQDVPKFEIGGEFTTLERGFFSRQTDPGVGARFTFNFNRALAFEAAGYIFPKDCQSCFNGGRMSQVVAGAKIGKRFEHWGIFAKARPGVVSFSRGEFNPVAISPTATFPVQFEVNRITSFATDLGGVLEFYPSRRIVTRFDVGDTIIHFGQRTVNGVSFDPTTQQFFLVPFVRPARTTHNFQFIAGVGFRF